MENKTYTEKCKELSNKLNDWVWDEYNNSFHNVTEVAYNSLPFTLVHAFNDCIGTYADSFIEEDYEDGEGWIDIDKWIVFFETHDLRDCAEYFLMFNHPEGYDPFGFTGFEPQLECIDAIIDEIIKNEKRNSVNK